MENLSYTKENIQELLAWAEKMLETGNYPKEKFMLDSSTAIFDGKLYLTNMIAMISSNWENKTYHPVVHQLEVYREKWEKSQSDQAE